LNWAFLLGSPDISGGSYVIFEHAIRAKRRGIDVTIITEEPVIEKMLDWHPESKELTWLTFDETKNILFDIAIATWWRTVYEIYRVKAKHYAYFVQSIESKFYEEKEKPLRQLVEDTYKLPFSFITEATWIKNYLKKNYDKNAFFVKNGIRKDIYTVEGERYSETKHGKLRVLIDGQLGVPFKNVEKTIEICNKSLTDEIWFLTNSAISSYPGIDRVFSRIPIFDTPKVYRSCDVLVKLSYVEGMFGPPLEMFHCGGTAITYDVTGHDEYIIHEKNALVVPKDNESQVIFHLDNLKKNPDFLEKLKKDAIDTAKKWPSWETQSKEFENTVLSISKLDSVARELIEKQSKSFFENYVKDENQRLSLEKKGFHKTPNMEIPKLPGDSSKLNRFLISLSLRYPNLYKKFVTLKLRLKK